MDPENEKYKFLTAFSELNLYTHYRYPSVCHHGQQEGIIGGIMDSHNNDYLEAYLLGDSRHSAAPYSFLKI